MILELAQEIANALVQELKPFCTRIEIAGSMRRQSPQVKDIEIVLARKPAMLYEFKTAIDKYLSFKGEAIGRYTQRRIPVEQPVYTAVTYTWVAADIFMPIPEDYFRQLAIRTGPAEFSHKVIATAWNKRGWVGAEKGLRREKECEKKGDKWVCIAKAPELPPVWQSEEEFFKWIGLRFVEAPERGMVPV